MLCLLSAGALSEALMKEKSLFNIFAITFLMAALLIF